MRGDLAFAMQRGGSEEMDIQKTCHIMKFNNPKSDTVCEIVEASCLNCKYYNNEMIYEDKGACLRFMDLTNPDSSCPSWIDKRTGIQAPSLRTLQ